MVPAECIQQPLIIGIFQAAVAQVIGDGGVQGFRFDLAVHHLTGAARVPQRQPRPRQPPELLPPVASTAPLRRLHLADRPQDVGQAFLLVDLVEPLRLILVHWSDFWVAAPLCLLFSRPKRAR